MRSTRWTRGRVAVAAAILAAAMGSFAFVAMRPEREITTRSPEARAAYMEGMEALRKIYTAEARLAWLRAVEADSSCSMAWLRLGRLAYENGDSPLAREYHARAEAGMGRLTGRERLFIRLLEADMKQGDAERDSLISEMVEGYPDDPEILFMAGNRDFHRKNYGAALSSFRKLLRKTPHKGEVYNMMGYALGELGRWPEAVEAFQKYAFLYPDQANPHDSLGELYLRTGRYDDALKEFGKSLALKPDFGWGHIHSAMAYAETGRYTLALASVRAAVTTSPDSPNLRMWERQEILFELAAGHHARALELALAHRDDHPGEPASYFMLGRIYVAQADLDPARRELTNLVEAFDERARLEPGSRDSDPMDTFMVNELKGELAAAEGNLAAADSCFAKAREKSNAWFVARRIEARSIDTMIRAGRHVDALAAVERVLAVNPNEPTFHCLAGRSLEESGRKDEAQAHYRAALEVLKDADPDHALLEQVAKNLSL
jgi:tetratricopeptide (TPR) repeat protein